MGSFLKQIIVLPRGHPSVYFLMYLLLSMGSLLAQQSRVHVQEIYPQPGDTLALPHQFLAPYSDTLFNPAGQPLPFQAYELNYVEGWLRVIKLEQAGQKYTLRYRYFLEPLKPRLAFRVLKAREDSLKEGTMMGSWIPPQTDAEPDFFWESSRIRKSGSLSRGITVGNNRNVALTSGLRLALEGDLGDGLKVVGAITDENIPIQPDGTTQQINDLDRVFVKLMKDEYSLTIGDYELSQKQGRFARYYRNVQGLRFDYEGEKHAYGISGAVAKGKFHTNSFQGREGIAGPYQLTGRNGERFFFVLAGSENVYLNGKLMKRGESEDYIIDYNTASITFTARHVITSVSRIVVDFEYNDQNFNRSLLVARSRHRLAGDRLNLRLFYGRDADNPNAPFENVSAFNEARDSLARVGDANEAAVTSSVEEVGFSNAEGQVRYLRRDTTINGEVYERYLFSRDSAAVYKISFSYLGPGMGHYVRDFSGINGVVFKWVAPAADGTPQGAYAPVRQWSLPRLLQVADMDVSYDLNDHLRVYNETAISLEDLNRLSSLGDEDNLDVATRTGVSAKALPLGESLALSMDLSHQYIGERFTSLDRVYQAEYYRRWNLEQQFERRNERISLANVGISYQDKLALEAELGVRNVGEGRNAYRQVYRLQSQWPKWLQGTYTLTRLENRERPVASASRWTRHEGDIYQPFGKWRLGMELWMEDREERQADSLKTGTFSFVDLTPYVRTVGTNTLQVDASYNYRTEQSFAQEQVRDKLRSHTYQLKWGLRPSPQFQLQHMFAYRSFRVQDTAFFSEGLSDNELVQTNLQLRYMGAKRALSGNLLYEVKSEGVARRDLIFVEVNPGQGQYEYIGDFNGNGLQDLEEFQLSTNPLIANYVRVLIPSRELFPTTKLSLNGSFRLETRKLIKNPSGPLATLLQQTRLISQFRVSQNKTENQGFSTFLINLADVFADTTLLDASYFFRQDLTFFPNHARGEIKFGYVDNQSKLFLNTGEELRSFTYWRFHQRLNVGDNKSLEHELRLGSKGGRASQFESRNFDIRFVETTPQVNIQLSRNLRISAAYTYKFKRNFGESQEVSARVYTHQLTGETNWNFKARNRLTGRLELINVRQEGEASFSGQYELREGLETGFNAIWQVITSFRLLSNVELNLTYDGRASRQRAVVHTGRVQVRAFF